MKSLFSDMNLHISNRSAGLRSAKISLALPGAMGEALPHRNFHLRFITPTCLRRPHPDCPLYILRGVLGPSALPELKKRYRFHLLRDALLLMRSLLRLWRHYSSTSISYYEYVSWLDEGDLVLRKVNLLRTLRHYEHKTTPKRPVGFVGDVTLRIPQDTYREGMAKTTTSLLHFGQLAQLSAGRSAGFGLYNITISEVAGTEAYISREAKKHPITPPRAGAQPNESGPPAPAAPI
jgi:hypothetical protein